ncbi:hypothetical protein ADK52_36930 [Streptomyces sp. WM6372]|uniref:hypothetical protein n=1 Tax=Streptomyces sp. WM6372 TaxID=1415555 RepID=UPI0006AE512E|nr:hypothetical protein [Streptomyces sp. WM6372]KOU14210.1 hypothetical protein ADK52_36930 [Streptomyces sp. WM6372]
MNTKHALATALGAAALLGAFSAPASASPVPTPLEQLMLPLAGQPDFTTKSFLTTNKHTRSIVLAYRGTKNLNNWVSNARLFLKPAKLPIPWDQAQAHTGFETASK